MSDVKHSDLARVGKIVRSQIEMGVLWSLGASNLGYSAEGFGGLEFDARILPFNKNGKRAAKPRVMHVKIVLNALDYYDVSVGFRKGSEWVEHFSRKDVDAFSLNRLLLALDWNGDEALNPRLAS